MDNVEHDETWMKEGCRGSNDSNVQMDVWNNQSRYDQG